MGAVYGRTDRQPRPTRRRQVSASAALRRCSATAPTRACRAWRWPASWPTCASSCGSRRGSPRGSRQERGRRAGTAGRRGAARDVRVLPRRDPAPRRGRRAAPGGWAAVPLAEVMTEFLLAEQTRLGGGQRAGGTFGARGARARHAPRRDYIVRDPQTDPRSELACRCSSTGRCGVCSTSRRPSRARSPRRRRARRGDRASFGAAVHRARLVADLERAFTTTLAALTEHGRGQGRLHGLPRRGCRRRWPSASRCAWSLSSAQARDVRYAAMLHDSARSPCPARSC